MIGPGVASNVLETGGGPVDLGRPFSWPIMTDVAEVPAEGGRRWDWCHLRLSGGACPSSATAREPDAAAAAAARSFRRMRQDHGRARTTCSSWRACDVFPGAVEDRAAKLGALRPGPDDLVTRTAISIGHSAL